MGNKLIFPRSTFFVSDGNWWWSPCCNLNPGALPSHFFPPRLWRGGSGRERPCNQHSWLHSKQIQHRAEPESFMALTRSGPDELPNSAGSHSVNGSRSAPPTCPERVRSSVPSGPLLLLHGPHRTGAAPPFLPCWCSCSCCFNTMVPIAFTKGPGTLLAPHKPCHITPSRSSSVPLQGKQRQHWGCEPPRPPGDVGLEANTEGALASPEWCPWATQEQKDFPPVQHGWVLRISFPYICIQLSGLEHLICIFKHLLQYSDTWDLMHTDTQTGRQKRSYPPPDHSSTCSASQRRILAAISAAAHLGFPLRCSSASALHCEFSAAPATQWHYCFLLFLCTFFWAEAALLRRAHGGFLSSSSFLSSQSSSTWSKGIPLIAAVWRYFLLSTSALGKKGSLSSNPEHSSVTALLSTWIHEQSKGTGLFTGTINTATAATHEKPPAHPAAPAWHPMHSDWW